jgi:predicted nuclease of predicted toxin-antitoxin system
MRLLIDMNLTPRWVPYLISAGHECAHWSGLGPCETPDDAICEFARAHQFVLVTNDLDFPQILAHTREAKPSVILLRGEPLTPELRGPALLNAIAESEPELESGAVLTVDWSDRVRARLLPLT